MNENTYTIKTYNGISKNPIEIVSPVLQSELISFIGRLPIGFNISVNKNKVIDSKGEIKRKKINRLRVKFNELRHLNKYTNAIRGKAIIDHGYNSPELDVAICLESIISHMKNDVNRSLEKEGVRRLK